MIKYNNSNINDWYFDTSDIIKVYRNNAICYYKITVGGGQTPCFAVVDDISQYSDTEFEDVFNKADGKWYKLNNLNQYEEYGVYGSGRTITTYEGKLTIDEVVIPPSSRLPQGYTEVEYIRQNNNYNAYINTGIIPYGSVGNTFVVSATMKAYYRNTSCDTFLSCEDINSPYFGFGYRFECAGGSERQIFGADGSATGTVVNNSDGTFTYTCSRGNVTTTYPMPISIFCSFNNSSYTSPYRFSDIEVHSMSITLNNETVRDFVPAKRDSDDKYGLYDLITDTFYISPNGNDFIGGSELPSTTATCEFIYSGESWVNVGEVSGSTIDTVWIDPPSTNDQNASFTVGHYWGEGYKMVMNAYISGSYSSDRGSCWRWNQHTPIEFNFYSNGFYYDFHNPTSTTSPDVNTGDYSWRIMKSSSLKSYENSQILNVILTNGTVRVELEETGAAIVTGSTSVSTQSWYNGLYQVELGIMNSGNKCHTSRIQIYNANNQLVNDIKFIKNQGVTGSQEISAYDSVLNVTYNNTNSYTPSYHIVEESGGTTYPMYYDEIQDPPDNVTFTSMTEAESYECPWVGMHATIAGSAYTFTSGYTWEAVTLPYTELQWIEMPQTSPYCAVQLADTYSTSTSLYYDFEILFNSLADTRIIGFDSNSYLIGYNNNTIYLNISGSREFTVNSQFTTNTKYHFGLGKRNSSSNNTFDNLDASTTYATFYTSLPKTSKPYFGAINNGSILVNGESERIYSIKVYDNEVLVGNYIPVKRNSDNFVTLYDTVSEQFCDTVGGGTMVAGPTV